MAQGWRRDLEREDSSDLHEHPPMQSMFEHTDTALLPLLHQTEVSAVLGERRNRGSPNRQNSSFMEIWNTRTLHQKWSRLLLPEKQQLMPKQE